MRFLVVVLSAVLLQANTVAAAGRCCDEHKPSATAACCKHHADAVDVNALPPLPSVTPGLEWPIESEPTMGEPVVRELAVVRFRDPVLVGDRVLIGKYVIEHDTERMARGLPCTHIYAAHDRRLPVVAFHCRHFERTPGPKASVTLQRVSDPSTRMFKLVEYQFAGSSDGHGVPIGQ